MEPTAADYLIQLLPLALVIILFAVPTYIILGRVGLSRAWTLLALVPFGVFVVLYMIALRRWPAFGQSDVR